MNRVNELVSQSCSVSVHSIINHWFKTLSRVTPHTDRTLSVTDCGFQWPRGLKRRSAAVGLVEMWVRVPPEAWMSVCYECCLFSGRGL